MKAKHLDTGDNQLGQFVRGPSKLNNMLLGHPNTEMTFLGMTESSPSAACANNASAIREAMQDQIKDTRIDTPSGSYRMTKQNPSKNLEADTCDINSTTGCVMHNATPALRITPQSVP